MSQNKSLRDLLPEEGCDKLIAAIHDATPETLHQSIADVIAEYKDFLLEKGVDSDYLTYAVEAKVLRNLKQKPEYTVGMRVRVLDGTGQNSLGEGTYEGSVKGVRHGDA